MTASTWRLKSPIIQRYSLKLLKWKGISKLNPHVYPCAHMCVHSVMSDCDSMNCRKALLSNGIPQARIWEWVAISFSRVSSQPRDGILVSCVSWVSWIGRRVLYHRATREALKSFYLFLTLWLLKIKVTQNLYWKWITLPKFFVCLFVLSGRASLKKVKIFI